MCLLLAPPAIAVDPEKARAAMDTVHDLVSTLFLHDADSAYESGDYETARQKFTWLAERGHAGDQYALGTLYEDGLGVLLDYAEAVKWYRKSARQGDSRAQLRLARMYYLGRQVPQDKVLAYAWLSLAARQGDADAITNLDRLSSRLEPEQRTAAQKLLREWAWDATAGQ